MTILVDLSTFALNANVILFDDKDLNNSQHIKVPYHELSEIASLAQAKGVKRIYLQGSPVLCRDYKDNLLEDLKTKYSQNDIEVIINN